VDRLAVRIRDDAGFRTAANVRAVTDVSTTSLEAYRLYSQGVDACNSMRLDDAHQLFEKAVAIDSTFADAYRYLGLINYIRGFPALRREYLRRAAEHSDRLSEPRRLLLDIDVARDSGNSTLAVRLLDELIAKYPDVDAYGLAFNVYRPVIGMTPNPEKLLAILSAGARALPSSTRVRHMNGYALMFAGRYADGLRELEAYAELAPREPNPYDSLGEGYLHMGAADKAVEAYSRALAIDPTFSFAHNGRAWSLATLGWYEQAVAENPPRPSIKAAILSRVGRYREASQAITEGRRQAEGRGDIEEQGSLHLLSSALSIERRHYSHSLQEIRSAEAMFGHLPPERRRMYLVLADLLRGVAEARTGRMDNARLRLESQRRTYLSAVDTENWWHRALEGEIALASGDAQKAAAAFLAGEPSRRWSSFVAGTVTILANNLPFRDGLARAAKRRGDVPSAIEIYRRLLTPGPEQKWIAVFEPLYVLEIARLLDQSGQKEAALQEYRRFLDFWKQADSDLPELVEARRAVGRMTLLERTTP
jgi:tetratricopeptide (TPR) repeat protein